MKKSNQIFTKNNITNFLAAFFVVFGLSFAVFSFVQAIFVENEESSLNVNPDVDNDLETDRVNFDEPSRILISKIGVDQVISNPESRDSAVLDAELLEGVVRYPDSGLLGETKNMFLFGHSTSFKVVQNQAFKAFNRLGELLPEDEIVVMSATEAHVYKVRSSRQVSANEAQIDFAPKRMLTLSTCNTFGRKEDRFIVEADFIRSYKLTR